MGRGLLALFASVGRHHLCVVHRQPLVGVDGDTEEARVGVDHPGCVTLFEVVQHSGLVQVGHHGHVLDLVKFGRVHGEDLVFFHCQSRPCFRLHCHFPSFSALDSPFDKGFLGLHHKD